MIAKIYIIKKNTVFSLQNKVSFDVLHIRTELFPNRKGCRLSILQVSYHKKNVISKNMKRAFACAGDQFLLDAVALIIVFRSSYNRC